MSNDWFVSTGRPMTRTLETALADLSPAQRSGFIGTLLVPGKDPVTNRLFAALALEIQLAGFLAESQWETIRAELSDLGSVVDEPPLPEWPW